MRALVILLMAGSVTLWTGSAMFRRAVSYKQHGRCDDAIAAFMAEHWECSKVHYTADKGLHAMCIGGAIAFTDEMVNAKKRVSSFIWTRLSNLEQGFCDCDRLEGPVCESLE